MSVFKNRFEPACESHVAAGVFELVREFLHALVQFFDLSENQPSRITSSRRAVAERL